MIIYIYIYMIIPMIRSIYIYNFLIYHHNIPMRISHIHGIFGEMELSMEVYILEIFMGRMGILW